MIYYSQAAQDKWVHELIGNSGYFVDVGAYDGIQTSNTFALELSGWKGICVEANAGAFRLLKENRDSINIHSAVTDHTGTIQFGVDRIGAGPFVLCDTLTNLLDIAKAPAEMDYLSIDIEGHELTVFSAFDFDRYSFKLMTVEHNLYCDGPEKKEALHALLTSKGYVRVVEDVRCLDPNPLYFNQPYEDWYASNSFYHTSIK